jgi:hypothetical protein
MERLLTVKEVAERYSKSEKTARRYMRKMIHQECPLMVSEAALAAWEAGRTYEPISSREVALRPHRSSRRPTGDGKHLISRVRPK